MAFADNFCVFADECAVQDAVFDVCPGVDDAVANDAVLHRRACLDADERAKDALIDYGRFMQKHRGHHRKILGIAAVDGIIRAVTQRQQLLICA